MSWIAFALAVLYLTRHLEQSEQRDQREHRGYREYSIPDDKWFVDAAIFVISAATVVSGVRTLIGLLVS